MTNIIKTIPAVTITVSQTETGLKTTNPVALKTVFPLSSITNVIQGGGTRFDLLEDVIEGPNPITGEVPVYDSLNDKYEVKRLDFDDLTGDIDDVDGGSF